VLTCGRAVQMGRLRRGSKISAFVGWTERRMPNDTLLGFSGGAHLNRACYVYLTKSMPGFCFNSSVLRNTLGRSTVKYFRESATLFLIACCAACTPMPIERTINHPIDTSQLGQFHSGVTTQTDVERVYGPPARTITNSQNGHTALVYAYSHVTGSAFGATNVNAQGVVFIFDANGRLISYRTNNTNDNVH